jgi:hypothetical protein
LEGLQCSWEAIFTDVRRERNASGDSLRRRRHARGAGTMGYNIIVDDFYFARLSNTLGVFLLHNLGTIFDAAVDES